MVKYLLTIVNKMCGWAGIWELGDDCWGLLQNV